MKSPTRTMIYDQVFVLNRRRYAAGEPAELTDRQITWLESVGLKGRRAEATKSKTKSKGEQK